MSRCKSHYVYLHRNRIIMPKEHTLGTRGIAIPEQVLSTKYGVWFPLTLLSLDLEGIIEGNFTPGMMDGIDGVLVAKNGKVYSVQYSNNVLDAWPIFWDRGNGYCTVPIKRGFDDVIATLHHINPDMDPNAMCEVASEIVLVRSGERYDFCLSELHDRIKEDPNVVTVEEFYSTLRVFNQQAKDKTC